MARMSDAAFEAFYRSYKASCNANNVAAYRQRQLAMGKRRVQAYISGDEYQALMEAKQPDETLGSLLGRAAKALSGKGT